MIFSFAPVREFVLQSQRCRYSSEAADLLIGTTLEYRPHENKAIECREFNNLGDLKLAVLSAGRQCRLTWSSTYCAQIGRHLGPHLRRLAADRTTDSRLHSFIPPKRRRLCSLIRQKSFRLDAGKKEGKQTGWADNGDLEDSRPHFYPQACFRTRGSLAISK